MFAANQRVRTQLHAVNLTSLRSWFLKILGMKIHYIFPCALFEVKTLSIYIMHAYNEF